MESSPAQITPNAVAAQKIRHLSAEARAAFDRFQTSRDAGELDPVILAILEDFIPRHPPKPLPEMPGDTRIMDDLGFDSLAMTEVIFFTEDLFSITISNQEIMEVRTLDDLLFFVRRKVLTQTGG